MCFWHLGSPLETRNREMDNGCHMYDYASAVIRISIPHPNHARLSVKFRMMQ